MLCSLCDCGAGLLRKGGGLDDLLIFILLLVEFAFPTAVDFGLLLYVGRRAASH